MTVSCCTPRAAHYPSGMHPTHRDTCPRYAGIKVGDEERVLRARAYRDHPTGWRAVTTWKAHATGCPCAACKYVEGWIDSAEDMEVPAW